VTDTPDSVERPIFAIFEGGGAKGVAHVGAMKAAEENDFAFAAVAGSSAGAVVATLIAAGFTADQIFNPDKPENNILRQYGKKPIDFFGKAKWQRFKRLREGDLARWLLDPRCWRVCKHIVRNRGYFSTNEIREFVNQVLRHKLEELYGAYSNYASDWKVPDRITFRDLDYTIFAGDLVPLKIVATNLRTGGLEVFERDLTPDVEIADAVAASIAIPVVFKPVMMRSNPTEGPYLDGGLVSNLPIWVFAEEKLKWERDFPDDPPIPIVGFALTGKPRSEVKKGTFKAFRAYMWQVMQTALSGSQTVAARFVEDLEVVRLNCGFEMLDFDKPLPEFVGAYREGKKFGHDQLTTAMILKPDTVRQVLESQVEAIKANIDQTRIAAGKPVLTHYRGCLIQMQGRQNLRVKYAVNMEDDADDRLLLDVRGGGAAEAFSTRDPLFQTLPNPQAPDYMRKYERTLVRSSLKGAICVPIFRDDGEWEKTDSKLRNEPLGVFCFDSDEDLKADYNATGFRDFIVKQSTLLRDALMFGADNG
jgi:NTE family protein